MIFGTGHTAQIEEPSLHGTRVSGIIHRVAPEARLFIADVYGEWNEQPISYLNIEAALDWVLQVSGFGSFRFKSVNISLGGVYNVFVPNAPAQYCRESTIEAEILALQSLDIPVAAATGNDGRTNWVDIPACMKRVVRVGTTYDAPIAGTVPWSRCSDINPRADQVACFSNAWSLPLILAPGTMISVGSLSPAGGTSFAAPHVSAAIAALRGEGPFVADSSECVIARLAKTGTPITDPRIGQVFPRIDLGAAARTYPNGTGDCDGNGRVRVSEIERMAAIALGAAPLSSCRRADPSGDGQVTVEELVSAVNVHLERCAVGASGYI